MSYKVPYKVPHSLISPPDSSNLAARVFKGSGATFGIGSVGHAHGGPLWDENRPILNSLIIDDSPFARRVIRHHLMKFGCKVVGEAQNAAEGVLMFEELRPELVTLDLMMPVVDNIDALRGFRAMRQKFPDLAVVIVTSVPFDRTRDTFIKEGALAYLVKPLNQYSFEPVWQKMNRLVRPHAA